MKQEIKWLLIVENTHGCDSDDPDYYNMQGYFNTEQEANKALEEYHLGGYELSAFIVKGKVKIKT